MKQENKQPQKVEKLERLELSSEPTLIITKKLKDQIDYLHQKVGKYEWSGELITSEKGSIVDLDNWKIIAEDIYLVDIGSSAYTDYEVEKKATWKAGDIVELYEKYPDLLEGKQKLQHIHSHNTMSTFFSNTDWENLEDRAKISNYFLMLIVNFDGTYCAKVAFKSKVEGDEMTKIIFSNNSDGFAPIEMKHNNGKEILTVMDCKVRFEGATVEESFSKRYDYVRAEIEKEKKKKEKSMPAAQKSIWDGSRETGNWKDFEWNNGRWAPKSKKVADMTEEEFRHWEIKNKWGRKHFHMLINAIVDKKITDDFSSSIIRLEEISKTLKTTIDVENFCADFQASLREYFDMLYPEANDEDYNSLMNVGMDILEPYTDNNDLTDKVFEIIWDESEEEELDVEDEDKLNGWMERANYIT